MKAKAAAILVILSLILGVMSGACAAPGDAVLFRPAEDGTYQNSVQSLAAVGDTLYLLTYNGLFAWKQNDAEPKLVSAEAIIRYAPDKWENMVKEDQEQYQNSVNFIMERGGKLYGLNTIKGTLLLLDITADGVKFSEVSALDWKDMFIQDGDRSYTRQIYGAVLMDESLYLLVQKPDDNWNEYDLFAFSLAAGTVSKVDADNVHAIARYENGQLLCTVYDWESMYTSDGKPIYPALSVLDPAAKSIIKLTDFPAEHVGGLCYSPENGMVYALGKGELYGCKPGSAFETVAYMPSDYPNDQLPAAYVSGGLYSAVPNYGEVHVRNIDPALKASRVLRIAGGYSDSVSQKFQADHPEVPVLFVDMPLRSAEQISQQMVSGTDSADLFIISLSFGGFSSLRDKGYVTDLSQSAVLTDTISKMYPQYVSDLFKDGKLIAFPCRFNAYTLGYSPDLLEELGIDKPPRTVPELMDLYVDWVDTYSVEYPSYTIQENIYDVRTEMLNTILMTYLAHYARTGEDLAFDTPLFRSLLKKLDEVSPILKELNPSDTGNQNGVVYSSGYGMNDKPTSLITNYYTFYPTEYDDDRGYLPLPLALEEGLEPALIGQIDVYIVNPNSKNQDLAISYLEHFAQNMPRDFSITFCPEDNTPYENPGYAKDTEEAQKGLQGLKDQLENAKPEDKRNLEDAVKSQEEYIAWREKSRYIISDKVIAQYRSLGPYVSVDTRNLNFLSSSPEALTLLQRFMQGELKTDQFVREFDRKVQMMRMENN